MAFALQKSQSEEKPQKRSPLAGWLGKKEDDALDEPLPEINVAAGLNRVLNSTKSVDEKRPKTDAKEKAVREALGAIEAALFAIDKIRDTLEQACEISLSAKSVEDVGGRALLAERFDELRLLINETVEKSDPRATMLIGKNHRHLDVNLGGKTRYSVAATRMDSSERGLNLSPPRDAFSTYEEIDQTLEQLDNALGRADRAAASYCRDAQYLIARMNGAFDE